MQLQKLYIAAWLNLCAHRCVIRYPHKSAPPGRSRLFSSDLSAFVLTFRHRLTDESAPLQTGTLHVISLRHCVSSLRLVSSHNGTVFFFWVWHVVIMDGYLLHHSLCFSWCVQNRSGDSSHINSWIINALMMVSTPDVSRKGSEVQSMVMKYYFTTLGGAFVETAAGGDGRRGKNDHVDVGSGDYLLLLHNSGSSISSRQFYIVFLFPFVLRWPCFCLVTTLLWSDCPLLPRHRSSSALRACGIFISLICQRLYLHSTHPYYHE